MAVSLVDGPILYRLGVTGMPLSLDKDELKSPFFLVSGGRIALALARLRVLKLMYNTS
jgi:hypothetical protein